LKVELIYLRYFLAITCVTMHNPNMPKRSSNNKIEKKNPAAVALGKLGGLKGGPARAKKLSPERRSELARKAVLARWAKQKS
jgi:hypothetical protein